jgi:hypothetical protein
LRGACHRLGVVPVSGAERVATWGGPRLEELSGGNWMTYRTAVPSRGRCPVGGRVFPFGALLPVTTTSTSPCEVRPLFEMGGCRGPSVRGGRPPAHSRGVQDSYLVDSASSHMLVSKIKPCMSKYKHLYRETANGSLNQLSFI